MDFRNDAVDAGKIGAAKLARALSATAQLHWDDPDSHQGTEIAPKPDLQALALTTSTPGIWPRALRVLIPAISWLFACRDNHPGFL